MAGKIIEVDFNKKRVAFKFEPVDERAILDKVCVKLHATIPLIEQIADQEQRRACQRLFVQIITVLQDQK